MLPRYVIDPRESQFTVQAFAGGVLSAFGHNPKFIAKDFVGEVGFDPAAPNEASLTMTMRAASLTLIDELSENDRSAILRTMHDEVLESSRYQDISYRCARARPNEVARGQFEITLDGELTLHGVSRVQPISAKLNATASVLEAFGEFSIRQSDYNIKPVTVAASMLKVKDELRCTFEFVARR